MVSQVWSQQDIASHTVIAFCMLVPLAAATLTDPNNSMFLIKVKNVKSNNMPLILEARDVNNHWRTGSA